MACHRRWKREVFSIRDSFLRKKKDYQDSCKKCGKQTYHSLGLHMEKEAKEEEKNLYISVAKKCRELTERQEEFKTRKSFEKVKEKKGKASTHHTACVSCLDFHTKV